MATTTAPVAFAAPPAPALARRGGYAVAALLALVSAGGLVLPDTYAREAAPWAIQAIAQDWFDLIVAVPCLAIATALAARGSWRARIVLAGALLFAVYTLAIYCFAVHLNPLFLLYCAALGVALYTLIPLATGLWRAAATLPIDHRGPRRTAAVLLVAIGAVFAALWLGQLVPAALTGTPPRELTESGLVTNPVHVLDLSFILPLHVVAGVALWRRRAFAVALAAAILAFGALMAASIAFLVAYAALRDGSGGAPIAAAMGAIALLSGTVAARLLR